MTTAVVETTAEAERVIKDMAGFKRVEEKCPSTNDQGGTEIPRCREKPDAGEKQGSWITQRSQRFMANEKFIRNRETRVLCEEAWLQVTGG